jgi:hypothetical protein
MSAGVPAPCHVAGNNDRYRSAPKASAPSASGQTLACRPQRACCGRWLDARWCTEAVAPPHIRWVATSLPGMTGPADLRSRAARRREGLRQASDL